MLTLLKRRKRNPRAELRELLGRYDLPSVSPTVINLLSLLRDPETHMSEVASRVEMDPGLTVRILRLINSAALGLSTQVSNLQHAVGLLGRSRLESLVLTFAAADQIPSRMECMETGWFWGAAARRATLARVLAQHMHAATQAEAFTAGLLLDIAVPVLAGVDSEGYATLLDQLHANDEARLDDLERELFGFDHATVGALMAEDWGLPEYLVKAIGGHHGDNAESGADPAVRLVSFAKYSPENDGAEAIKKAAENEFGIEEFLIEEMIARSFADAEQFAEMFFD
ncbi:MAG: HDOD domain-containing protein [Candidatus Eisenbacteria sp.]|nr:HDOD domain-containing protein [Candidatus Eisenbacteria bacterium]